MNYDAASVTAGRGITNREFAAGGRPPFRPDVIVSSDLYPPSDVDPTQRPLRDLPGYLAYLTCPLDADQMHLIRLVGPHYAWVKRLSSVGAALREDKLWETFCHFYERIYKTRPLNCLLEAMKFRLDNARAGVLFDTAISVPHTGFLGDFRALCLADGTDILWESYSAWNTPAFLCCALDKTFGGGWYWHGLAQLVHEDKELLAWGYRARQHVYSMNVLDFAVKTAFKEYEPPSELAEVELPIRRGVDEVGYW
ncbi:hypothetical protein BDZ89DRAFT_1043632 [Hymenopellis radicata]|nr:hypothetical protein BDZ89DRAFT_1043632 [Hymenopellis radicata]